MYGDQFGEFVCGYLTIILMNEAEYLMKNYGDRRGGWADITPSKISIILYMIRKPNSIINFIFLLFIHYKIIPSSKR